MRNLKLCKIHVCNINKKSNITFSILLIDYLKYYYNNNLDEVKINNSNNIACTYIYRIALKEKI